MLLYIYSFFCHDAKKNFKSTVHMFPFILALIGCLSQRTTNQSESHQHQTFQLPFFKDAESLNRELGLLRLRQLEDEDNILVLSELTAGFTVQAMMADNKDSQRSLELARQYGTRCLRTSSGFESLLQSRGVRITPKAVNVLEDEPQLKHCKRWTGIAWSLWLLERGVLGASIDVKSVQAMSPSKPKGPFEQYQLALSYALDLDSTKNEQISELLLKASQKSVLPHRMHYEHWRLLGNNVTDDWLKLLSTADISSLNAVEREAIQRVFPDRISPSLE